MPLSNNRSGQGLDAFSLKIIAIAAMLIDHIGYIFFPQAQWMRVIGRLTFPIMAFFIVQGYHHTRSVRRYILRLLLAAAVSAVPFGLAFNYWFNAGNVMLTLALGVAALWVSDHIEQRWRRAGLIILLCALSVLGDWNLIGVPIILSFHDAYKQGKTYSRWTLALFGALMLTGVFNAAGQPDVSIWERLLWPLASGGGCLFALPLLTRYNGRRGPDARWLFYGFYPLHLAVLAAIRLLLARDA